MAKSTNLDVYSSANQLYVLARKAAKALEDLEKALLLVLAILKCNHGTCMVADKFSIIKVSGVGQLDVPQVC